MGDFGDYAVGDLSQELCGDIGELDGHCVGGDDGADADGVIIGARVAHHADGAHAGEDGEILPDIAVEAGLFDLIAEYVIGIAEYGDLFLCDIAEYAYAQAGAGEGLAPNELLWHAEGFAYGAHLVLEEGA